MLVLTRQPTEGIWVGDRHVVVNWLSRDSACITIRRGNSEDRTVMATPGVWHELGRNSFFQVVTINGEKVRLGLEAPPETRILRDELVEDGRSKHSGKNWRSAP